MGDEALAEVIAIEPEPRSWAVKHNDGFLGRTDTREQALAVAGALVQWMSEHGRPAEVIEAPERTPRNASSA